jgi:hypothetical protein
MNNGKNVGHGRQRMFRGRAATTPPPYVCLNTPTVRALRLVGGRASLARWSGMTPPRKGTERRVPLRASELALMWLHNLLTVTRPLHSVSVRLTSRVRAAQAGVECKLQAAHDMTRGKRHCAQQTPHR